MVSLHHRLDKNAKGGGILLHVREDIPSRLLNSKYKTGIGTISVEIKLRKRKTFLNCSNNPNKNVISNHLKCLNRIMDEFSENYNNIVFLGDSNTCINDNAMTSLCFLNDLSSLIDQLTCYTNPGNSTCIDLTLTNRSHYL